jgi:uncharacterized glyoxalase superfamily protein PhnB
MNAPRLNPENLKKQAKLILRQHRRQYYPVCPRLRAALPRYASSSDREILDAPLALHDAQEVIAREHGFENWAAFIKKGTAMSSSTHAVEKHLERPRVICAFPQLFVRDVTQAAQWYKEELGFEVQYLYGKPPFYGFVKRANAGLNLRHVDSPVTDQGLREREDLLSAVIVVEGVKTLFLEFKKKGLMFHQTLKRQPWGAEDFIVKDPDGNLLCFASPK